MRWRVRVTLASQRRAKTMALCGAGCPSIVFRVSLGSNASRSECELLQGVALCSSVEVADTSITRTSVKPVSLSQRESSETVGMLQTLLMFA